MRYTEKLMLNGEEYYFAEGQGGWQPGANTIAYYKFDGNLNDETGNHSFGSATYGSFNYLTTTEGAKYLNSTAAAYPNPISIPYSTSNYTINFWIKHGGSNMVFLDFQPGTSLVDYWNRLQFNSSSSFNYVQGRSAVSHDFTNWTNVIIVNDSNTSYCYINGSYITSQATNSYDMTINYFGLNRAGYADAPQNTSGAINLSELIIEDTPRTAQEVANYFNQTKSLYGIS